MLSERSADIMVKKTLPCVGEYSYYLLSPIHAKGLVYA